MQEQLFASERLKALTDRLEQGVSDIFQSGQYAAYLTAMSKFHHYSFGNAMLIFMQCPNASHVAGYHDWKRKFGRQVKRGEHGITILAPCPYRRRKEVEETAPDGSTATTIQLVQRVGFRTVTVFDVSQTEGKPLSELVHKLTGDVADYERMTEAICALSPYPINIEAFPGAAYGCCNFVEQRILVQPDMSQVQTIKTMIHEVSHAKLHALKEDAVSGENRSEQRSSREVEAESVAYVVCQHFGIDTSDYSFGYVAGWSRGKDLSQLKTSLERIRDTAAELIDSIDPPKELSPPVQENRHRNGGMPVGKEISLIAFLDEVVSRNTQHYKSDFELDAQKLRDALDSPNQDERIFYFMSRPSGTWCVLERDAFLRESDGYKIWTHYANMPAGIVAYRVVITGRRGTAPMGYVVKLNYREQVQRVIKAALPIENVELTFYSGEKVSLPPEQYRKRREELFWEYGVIRNFRNCPKSEAELYRIISMEHRLQKGWRPKVKKRPDTPTR